MLLESLLISAFLLIETSELTKRIFHYCQAFAYSYWQPTMVFVPIMCTAGPRFCPGAQGLPPVVSNFAK